MWTVRIVHRNNKNIPPRVTTRKIARLDDLKETVEEAVSIADVELIELSAYDQEKANPAQINELMRAIHSCDKIAAIKAYRTITGYSLLNAKNAVEQHWKDSKNSF